MFSVYAAIIGFISGSKFDLTLSVTMSIPQADLHSQCVTEAVGHGTALETAVTNRRSSESLQTPLITPNPLGLKKRVHQHVRIPCRKEVGTNAVRLSVQERPS